MTKFKLLMCASASVLSLATPAYAQDTAPAAEASSADSEIIVSARRREESIQDVPLSLQAITSQQLEKLEVRDFQDIQKLVPGLQLASQGFSTSASLRGITFDGRASGASPSVEFYRNDAVITSNALFAAVYDVGQIEVLRGPQGTLRGRASPSGSITITTRRPDLGEVGAYASGSVASHGKYNLEAAVNVPVIADKVGVRVAGYTGRSRGNNIRGLNVPLGTIDDDIFASTEALRASVRADPFDGVLVLDFNFETIHVKNRQYSQSQSLSDFNGGALSPRTVTVADRLGTGARPSTQDSRFKIYNWQAKFRRWGQTLTYVGNRLVGDAKITSLSDGGSIYPTANAAFPFLNAPAGLQISELIQLTDQKLRQNVHELRLQNEDRVAGIFDYVIGGFTAKATGPSLIVNGNLANCRAPTPSLPVVNASPLTCSPLAPVSTSTAVFPNGTFPTYRADYLAFSGTYRPRFEKESSLFGNITVHLGENTEVSGGMRHIWWKGDSGTVSGISLLDPSNTGRFIQRACYGDKVLPDLSNPALGANYVCGSTKEATIYAASIKHTFSRDLMVYGSFGTSWRSGNPLVGWGLAQGLSPVYGSFVSQFLIPPDEKSKTFEVGVKSSWLDQRLRLNISAFYQKFDNFPIYPGNAVSLSSPGGAGNPTPVLVNSFSFVAPSDVTVKGVEADLAFDVSDRFNLAATFAFADSKAKNARVPCNDLNDDNIQDATTPTLAALQAHVGANQIDTCLLNAAATSNARFSGTVQAEYSHPVGDWATGYLRGFVNWKGASANDATNPNDNVPSYALVDLFAGLRSPERRWEVGLFVKNLFDKQLVLSRASTPGVTSVTVLNQAGTGTSTANVGYNYLGIGTTSPREFGLSVRVALGSR